VIVVTRAGDLMAGRGRGRARGGGSWESPTQGARRKPPEENQRSRIARSYLQIEDLLAVLVLLNLEAAGALVEMGRRVQRGEFHFIRPPRMKLGFNATPKSLSARASRRSSCTVPQQLEQRCADCGGAPTQVAKPALAEVEDRR
jgi:hypothetical protein